MAVQPDEVSESQPKESPKPTKAVYILMTQCLQNGFFLADENRLCLPRETVKQMLVGEQEALSHRPSLTKLKDELTGEVADLGKPDSQNRRQYGEYVKHGPLYSFLNAAISPFKNGKVKNDELHVINIRDWHVPSKEYDLERNAYGAHCEANTWDADYIDGFEDYLSPWGKDEAKLSAAQSKKGYHVEGEKVTFHDVRSDSVFDFRSDVTITRHKDFDGEKRTHLQVLLDTLIEDQPEKKRVYIVLVGVYTDIKIKILLLGLRTRYDVDNLIISDVLTASPILERHLEGLDFAAKVLNVEVMHSINELASVLNPEQDELPILQSLTKNMVNFRDYRTYFLDKQNILGFQDKRLIEYLELTNNRSLKIYETIYSANRFLIFIGVMLLALMVLLIILRIVGVNVGTDLIVVTGGLGTLQVLTSFFSGPFDRMRQNLTGLVRLRNYLETYSNLSALLRHHLTLADRLQPNFRDETLSRYEQAKRELELLEWQMKLVQNAAAEMTRNFPDLMVNPKLAEQLPVPGQQTGSQPPAPAASPVATQPPAPVVVQPPTPTPVPTPVAPAALPAADQPVDENQQPTTNMPPVTGEEGTGAPG